MNTHLHGHQQQRDSYQAHEQHELHAQHAQHAQEETMKDLSEIELNYSQANKAAVEAILAAKKARWYELVIFGGAGITIGLGLSKTFFG